MPKTIEPAFAIEAQGWGGYNAMLARPVVRGTL